MLWQNKILNKKLTIKLDKLYQKGLKWRNKILNIKAYQVNRGLIISKTKNVSKQSPYKEFIKRLSLFISKYPSLITTTLSNMFTMRLIGNKTHGDLAEIAIAEFINQYM